MDSMPLLDDFNYNEINLDFLEAPPHVKPIVGTNSNTSEGNLKAHLHGYQSSSNEVIINEQFDASKLEIKDFNLDFLESPLKGKSRLNFATQCSIQNKFTTSGITTKTEHKKLAQRIAAVDTLVRQLKVADTEKSALQKQMEDFNKSAKDIQLLYNKERCARTEAETKNKKLELQCADLETELAAKSLELDQVQAQMEECSGPILYSELATRYLKLAHKLDEERLLHWHDQPLFKDITMYCKEKGLKIPKIVPRSPPKRKVTKATLKIDAQMQCNLLTEIEKPKIQQRHQSTQSIRTETRSQGCQHIGTTTTRGTTTDCFFKYHDAGTNCDPINFEPAFNDILTEMRSFGDQYAPLSPIAEILDKHDVMPVDPISELSSLPEVSTVSSNEILPKITYNSIGTNTNSHSQRSGEYKSVGCCTYICNVQRPLDFMVPIKRSTSRPPSVGLAFESVKDESNSRSSNSSPTNYNMNMLNNLLPPILSTQSSSSAAILPNTFDEIWQVFGQIMLGLLNRRMSSLNNSGNGANFAFAPNNITNQQDFYNWLHALYNNVQTSQSTPPQNVNPNVPILPQRATSLFTVCNMESAASSNCSTSNSTNETTPLSFSGAAPSAQTSPNVIKPTALRSNLRNSTIDTEESNTYSQAPIVCKSIATSPIRCINPSPVNKIPSDAFGGIDDCEESYTASAFIKTTIKPKEDLTSTSKKVTRSNMHGIRIVKNTSYKLKKLKRPSLIKCRQSRNMDETAVEFLAKLQHNPNIAAKNSNNSCSTFKNGNVEKPQKQTEELRQLNYMLFGSDSDTETKVKTKAENLASNVSTLSNSSCDTLSSNETIIIDEKELITRSCYIKDVEDQDTQSQQMIDDIYEKNENEQSKQNSISVEFESRKSESDFENAPTYNEILQQSESVDECQLTFETGAIAYKNEVRQNAEPINETQKKRGRKRKVDTVAHTTSHGVSPCKRSARLLAKQVNQQGSPNTQLKQLPLLTLDYSSLNKSSSKKYAELELSKAVCEQPLKSDPQPNDLAKINKNLNTSAVSLEVKPACPPYSLRILPQDIKETANTKPNTLSLKDNAIKRNSPILSMPTSTTISLKNFNLKSSIYTTPYASQNTATITNAKNTIAEIDNTQLSLPNYGATYFPTTKTAKFNISQKSIEDPDSSVNSASTSAEIVQKVTAQNSASTFHFCPSKNITNATEATNLSSGAQTTNLSFYGTQETSHTTTTWTSNAIITAERDAASNDASNLVKIHRQNTDEISTYRPPTESFSPNTLACESTPTLEISSKPNHLIENLTHYLPVSTSKNISISYDSPPASPVPTEMAQIHAGSNTIKEIPLELSMNNFPTWRRWRQHQRSLLHNLISVYDSKLYQGFHSNEMTELETKTVQQLVIHLNEFIKHTSDMHTSATLKTVKLAVFCLKEKFEQITTDGKLIAQAIKTSMQKQQRPITAPYEQYVNGAPRITTTTASSQTQIHDPIRCCSYILDQTPSETLTVLLQLIESTLFDIKSADSLSLYDVLNLTDLYLLILRKRFCPTEMNPARLFIAKCLYYHKLKAAPMIYAVLCTFPTVLPHREERRYDRSDALITVIQHCLMCNAYDMNNSELLQRELLSKLRFEHHFECFKPDFHEVLTNLIEKLRAGKLDNLKFAFAIFCKRQPPERVVRDVLQQYFIPLANEYYRLVEESDAYEARLATLLDCFSIVIKPFPRNNSATHEMTSYLNFFKRFLTMPARLLVQEAAIHAVLRLQRFDFLNCYRALAHLRPEFELQANTRAALKTFIYRKPLSFWKSLIQQSS